MRHYQTIPSDEESDFVQYFEENESASIQKELLSEKLNAGDKIVDQTNLLSVTKKDEENKISEPVVAFLLKQAAIDETDERSHELEMHQNETEIEDNCDNAQKEVGQILVQGGKELCDEIDPEVCEVLENADMETSLQTSDNIGENHSHTILSMHNEENLGKGDYQPEIETNNSTLKDEDFSRVLDEAVLCSSTEFDSYCETEELPLLSGYHNTNNIGNSFGVAVVNSKGTENSEAEITSEETDDKSSYSLCDADLKIKDNSELMVTLCNYVDSDKGHLVLKRFQVSDSDSSGLGSRGSSPSSSLYTQELQSFKVL